MRKLLLIGILFLASCDAAQQAEDAYVEDKMQHISNKVAEDAVKQYEIAKSGGDKTDIYVQASLVAAAYLQAKDEVNYKKWKEIEKQAAKDAGMPDGM